MADRKAELEKKRKRLDEIRRRRELKKQEKEAEQSTKASSSLADDPGLDETTKDRKDVHDLVESLLGSTAAAARSSPGPQIREKSPVEATPISDPQPEEPKKARLGVTVLAATNIPPKETVLYAKETQTLESFFAEEEEEEGEEVEPTQRPDIEDTPIKIAIDNKENESMTAVELSDETKKDIMKSETFLSFFDRTTRIMERALAAGYDVTEDYAGDSDTEMESAVAKISKLEAGPCFMDDKWSRHRCVTSLAWSQTFPELFLSSYHMNEEAKFDPDGVVLLWNLKYQSTAPEFVFHCQSAVMSATFTSFHPRLVIGGTYSGQIVLWDLRANKRTPVQRSPLSANAHTHPVYCLRVVGSQNAHNLISVSTDGKMCSWSVDMLSQPQDRMELQYQTKPIACLCMDFPRGNIKDFLVGSEEGIVFQGTRLGSKSGVHTQFEGHSAPISGLHINPVSGKGTNFSDLFLTSSFDWTVKLWSQKLSKSLFSFEGFNDYVYDVKWSPVHPGLFASVDGMKKLKLWNLAWDTETPIWSEQIDSQTSCPNSLRWSGDGKHIAVGDGEGKVYLLNLPESVARPSDGDWDRLNHVLSEMEKRD